MAHTDERSNSPDLTIQATALQTENLQLKAQLLALQEELHCDRETYGEMVRRMHEVQNRYWSLAQMVERIETENAKLTRLNVAATRLAQAQNLPQSYETVQEIVANLMGCEEIALFAWLPHCQALSLLWSRGIDPTWCQLIPAGSGIVGQCISSGESYWGGGELGSDALDCERELSACVVLKARGTSIGALALFRLLPQKTSLDNDDLELLALLETHVGMALEHALQAARQEAEITPEIQ